MRPLPPRTGVAALLAAALAAGCAQTGSKTGQRVEYACDEGNTIVMHYSPARDAARIEIGRLHFDLIAERSGGSGERFGCGMLTVEDQDGRLQVTTENVVTHRNCSPHNTLHQR